jgi:hypothetical protein
MDTNDIRAGHNLASLLDTEAQSLEERSEGVFTDEPADRSLDAASALKSFAEARSLYERLLQLEPEIVNWRYQRNSHPEGRGKAAKRPKR